ncbi:hypothetical protein ACN47E_007034 [Coniothyrium glycines]
MMSLAVVLAIFAAQVYASPMPITGATAADGYFDVQSDGFRLVLSSSNSTLDGQVLGACHQGAAVESLCTFFSETVEDPVRNYNTFWHNVSSAYDQPANAVDTAGVLGWLLVISDDFKVPSTMSFSPAFPAADVADMIFSPGPAASPYTLLSFDEDDYLYVEVPCDQKDGLPEWHTAVPPALNGPTEKLQNWYICVTQWSYRWNELVWKIGAGKPQDPTCVAVKVQRIWNPTT